MAEDATFNADQVKQIEDIFGNYLQDNPKVVIDAIEKYQKMQQEEAEQSAQQSIQDNLAKLTSGDLPSVGNPDAKVTVVEFFDYNCGYCKRAVPDIQEIVKSDDDVRFVFKEMPILGPTSLTASQYALAAHKQGKYFEYHVALMDHRGTKNAAELEKLGKEVGLDVDQLKKDVASPDLQKDIQDSVTLAQEIGIRGTPAFIIDGQLFRGYLGEGGLKSEIQKAHEASADSGRVE